jgi:hypothetical protein
LRTGGAARRGACTGKAKAGAKGEGEGECASAAASFCSAKAPGTRSGTKPWRQNAGTSA